MAKHGVTQQQMDESARIVSRGALPFANACCCDPANTTCAVLA
jgi:hypothetical protein